MKKYSIIFLLFAVFGLIFLFKLSIINTYYFYFFNKEIKIIKNSLILISNDDHSDLHLLTTNDSNVLRVEIADKLSMILKSVNLKTLKVIKINTKNERNTDVLFADIYFKNDIEKGMHVKLEKQNEKWKIDSISVSEGITGIR